MNDEFDFDLEGRVYEEITEMIRDFYDDEGRIRDILEELNVSVNSATISRVKKAINNARDEVTNIV